MTRLRRAALFFSAGLALLILVLFLPVFPWAPRCQHTLNRAIAKTRMRIYRWRGQEPRLVSLTGRTDSPGAEVYALDSTSGWAALADREGEFTLAGITWYPGETVNLVLCSPAVEDNRIGTLVGFTLPSSVPEDRTFQIGEVRPAGGRPVDLSGLPGLNAITRE